SPGNLPVRLVVDPRPPVLWRHQSDVSVMLVSGHAKSDPLRHYTASLASILQELKFGVTHVEVASESELLDQLKVHSPEILYISTHGVLTPEFCAGLPF